MALPATIEQIRSYVHGTDVGVSAGNFDYVLVADFDDAFTLALAFANSFALAFADSFAAEEVAKANHSLPKVAKVRRFVLLYKELDADDEELTRTRKVRRNFVIKRYRDLVNALYGDRDELNIEWGQLQIEQSTWAQHARIEQVATEDL